MGRLLRLWVGTQLALWPLPIGSGGSLNGEPGALLGSDVKRLIALQNGATIGV
jgi:hypothetical protein